jgi:invasion protein IalB
MSGVGHRGAVAAALAGLLAVAATTAALAQDDAADAAAEAQLQAYGDWALRCVERENAAPCDIVQILNDRESGAQIAAMSIAYSPAQSITAVQIMAPLGVHLPTGLRLEVGALMVPGVRYARCELQGCVVEARLGDDMIAAMRDAPSLKLSFGLSAQREGSALIGLDGFAEAYDALLAETAARTPQ